MKNKFIIDTPPPTISGNLHIGHIFSYSHIDFIARYQKFLGKDVVFPIGFDNNGLPTEKLLIDHPEKKIEEYIKNYEKLFKTMNFSMDFDNYYTTKDKEIIEIIYKSFKKLYSKKLIYKSFAPTYYDPYFKTVLSNSEVIEKDGIMIGERSKIPVELRQTEQWFVKILPFKDIFKKMANKITWYPENTKDILFRWIDNLDKDWCISRQRKYGIKIPLDSESDMLDTWFVSAHTPLLFTKTCDVRFQSHEIIRSWTFYTLVIATLLKNPIPFKNICISGWCINKDKNKISKSDGVNADPYKLIEKYSVNAIRYWAAKASLGKDTLFSEHIIQKGNRVITKLKNANKFCQIDFEFNNESSDISLEMKSNFKVMRQNFIKYFNKYEFSNALEELEKFLFDIFCGQYIEHVKNNKHKNNIKILKYMMKELNQMFNIFFP